MRRCPFEVKPRKTELPLLAALAGAALLAGLACTFARHAETGPELAERLNAKVASSDLGMVASSAPEANRIGLQVLANGGNAVDAAVAVAIALGAVDAGDSGLGGATFILYRKANGESIAIDGSAPVPIHASRAVLQKVAAEKRNFGPELACTPGSLAALEYARAHYGTRPLRELVEPSIPLAEAGLVVTPFQTSTVAKYLDDIRLSDPLCRVLLGPDSQPIRPGSVLRWPGLTHTLRAIADGGAAEFYRGTIAAEIEADMIRHGGFVRRDDLGLMRVRVLEPLHDSYRGLDVLSFPLPASGGAVLEGLNILESFPVETLQRDDVERLQVMAEALHLALEDHRRLSGDPNLPQRFQNVTYQGKAYAKTRADLIVPGRPVPESAYASSRPEAPELESQTVQVSVIDHDGNAVALTQSLGRFYGNKVLAEGLGFLYNTFLSAIDPNHPQALRPRAIIPCDAAPTIVVKDGALMLVLGSAGSSRIPGAVVTVISNVVDRAMPLGAAVQAPRVLWSKGTKARGLLIEVLPPVTESQVTELEAMGYTPGAVARFPAPYLDLFRFGGVNAILRDPTTGHMTGVGDPRRNADAQGL